MKLYRIQRQWWVDALLSKRMGELSPGYARPRLRA